MEIVKRPFGTPGVLSVIVWETCVHAPRVKWNEPRPMERPYVEEQTDCGGVLQSEGSWRSRGAYFEHLN